MTPIHLAASDGVELDAVVHQQGDRFGPTVILAHGITVDLDEGGMFVRLADRLAQVGFTAVRFSFRGHGRSGGAQRGATIAGEMLDLDAVVAHVRAIYPGPVVVVAASFAAVPVALSLPYLRDLAALVLWNPVLDLRRTFTHPELPWGVDNFGPAQQQHLAEHGSLMIDDEWEMGRVMFDEIRTYDTIPPLLANPTPALAVHGDCDTYVPYDVTKAVVEQRADTTLHTIVGSDHGFDTRDREDEAITVTLGWLTQRFPTES